MLRFFSLRSKIGIVVRLFCAAVALLMVLTVDATPQNYKYYKPKPIYEGAPSYEQDRYPDNSKHKTYGNYGYQDNSYGNQERYAPRTVMTITKINSSFLSNIPLYRVGQMIVADQVW